MEKVSVKVLNIAQPNAHYVIFSGKNVENRGMISYLRGTIAIYASATYQKARFENSQISKDDCSYGCIVGFVDIVDCIVESQVTKETKEWFCGPYGYIFENVRVLEKPIPVSPPKGAVTWWDLTGKKAADCIKQIISKSVVPLKKLSPDKSTPKPKVKTARSLLIPSDELAVIIGKKPVRLNKVFELLEVYFSENEILLDEGDDEKSGSFKADTKLQKLFGRKVVAIKDVRDLLLENLHLPE